MEEKDLLEILATAAVVELARQLRNRHVREEDARAGQQTPDEKYPPVDRFFEEAALLMRRRRGQIIPMLKG